MLICQRGPGRGQEDPKRSVVAVGVTRDRRMAGMSAASVFLDAPRS